MKPGPIIGILTDRIRRKKDLIYKATTREFRSYLEACNEIGASLYTFDLNYIDFIDKKVYGYIPSIDSLGKMVWDGQLLPIPDLIVNRAYVSASSNKNEKINKLINAFPNIKIINRVTQISKWEVYQALKNNNDINMYLPKTVLFEGIDSLSNMLNEFSCVYLKPTDGSLGIGIARITKDKGDEYLAEYRLRKNNYSISGSLSDILLQLEPLMEKSIYTIQEGIPLATYRGNIFDLRVCVQKDGTGKWMIPVWIIRAANPDNVVTNCAAGGISLKVEDAINALFPDNASEVLDKIKNASILISEAIEKNFPGTGDIGMDVAITNTGKIYFIEANLRQNKFTSDGSYKGHIEYLEWKITSRVPIYYLNYLYELETNSPKS
ncbi:YheC/YheD family protein [Candidatus Clostridium stratigraminis]|uniref:YheC/YheD family protein n=1 Tax=Candidatus Clostridium stratigraminis TaxID=3381661 RepID=A0ABW8T7F0_9CLOT